MKGLEFSSTDSLKKTHTHTHTQEIVNTVMQNPSQRQIILPPKVTAGMAI